jgi:hypothetical protein
MGPDCPFRCSPVGATRAAPVCGEPAGFCAARQMQQKPTPMPESACCAQGRAPIDNDYADFGHGAVDRIE